jgi:hypothetical protein
MPTTYRIRVQGFVDGTWADQLGGMAVRNLPPEDGAPVAILVGRLPDQAALSGVLNTLYDLHLPILSVDILEDK